MVRCKMRCVYKAEASSQYGGAPAPVSSTEIRLQPLAGPGNEEWTKYTPGGELKLIVTNPAASEQFKAGQDYFIDISPVE